MSTAQPRNDTIEHGDLSALICSDEAETQTAVIEQLTQLGFGIHTALNPEEVTVKLKALLYDVVVISERFSGADAQTNCALLEIARMPLVHRRESFVILVGPGMVSRSEMQAFTHSVDLVVKDSDLADLKTVAGRGIVRQEEFYAAFNSVIKAIRAV